MLASFDSVGLSLAAATLTPGLRLVLPNTTLIHCVSSPPAVSFGYATETRYSSPGTTLAMRSMLPTTYGMTSWTACVSSGSSTVCSRQASQARARASSSDLAAIS